MEGCTIGSGLVWVQASICVRNNSGAQPRGAAVPGG